MRSSSSASCARVEALRRFKVVVVTDRKNLERQLSDTRRRSPARPSQSSGKSGRRVKELLLSRKGPGARVSR